MTKKSETQRSFVYLWSACFFYICCKKPPIHVKSLPLLKRQLFLFMWVRRFCGCHKTATEGGCFLAVHCFSMPVTVWHKRFPPHAQHASMQKPPPCGCGSMQRQQFSPTRINIHNEQHNANHKKKSYSPSRNKALFKRIKSLYSCIPLEVIDIFRVDCSHTVFFGSHRKGAIKDFSPM
jgi:hypothetical protein